MHECIMEREKKQKIKKKERRKTTKPPRSEKECHITSTSSNYKILKHLQPQP